MQAKQVFSTYNWKEDGNLGRFEYCPFCGTQLALIEKGGKPRPACPSCALISSHPGCTPWRSSCWLVWSVESSTPRTIWRPWSGFPCRGRCQRWLLTRTRTSANGTIGRNWEERLSIPAMPLESNEWGAKGKHDETS
jgi:hypothetical protein